MDEMENISICETPCITINSSNRSWHDSVNDSGYVSITPHSGGYTPIISRYRSRVRATPDYTGRETVDILALLGDKSNHWRIVSKILSFLGPQDLCSISMVSKTWKRICINDSRANTRRLIHVILRQNAKENLKLIKKSKIEGDIQSSPRSRYARKGYLLEVQNLLQVPGNQLSPSSPPVSPSKVKFHSFVKLIFHGLSFMTNNCLQSFGHG
ncbi:F-box only protein 43-like isoform X2 [Bombus flavifrons]|uniref:F-box only protein 43-like isoform X2 n=1 Tax=Bombus flavifrons TaxID=103934 RepID=UPI003703C2E6